MIMRLCPWWWFSLCGSYLRWPWASLCASLHLGFFFCTGGGWSRWAIRPWKRNSCSFFLVMNSGYGLCVECMCMFWRKQVKGWEGTVCGQHLLFHHLFWHGQCPFLSAWRAGLQAHSDLTSSRWEDRPGIPSASGCGAPWEGRGRGEVGLFLCKSSCQKGLRNRFVRLGWMKLLSISHSSVWINNYHRPAGTPPKTRAGPALPDQDLWAP